MSQLGTSPSVQAAASQLRSTPEPRTQRSEFRPSKVALVLFGHITVGALAGVVWRLIAPTGQVIPGSVVLHSVGDPELIVAQDGTFMLVAAAAGLLSAAWMGWRAAYQPVRRLIVVSIAALCGSLVAWWVGSFLGPAEPTQLDIETRQIVTSPLAMHSWPLLTVWPGIAALALSLYLSVRDWYLAARR